MIPQCLDGPRPNPQLCGSPLWITCDQSQTLQQNLRIGSIGNGSGVYDATHSPQLVIRLNVLRPYHLR